MTSKKAIKKMMAAGIPRDTARLWSDVGTAFRLTNETVAMLAIHCEGKRPAEILSAKYYDVCAGFFALPRRLRKAVNMVIV